jgi:excisionase family DNA binding protein
MITKKEGYMNKKEIASYTGLAMNSVRAMMNDGRLPSELVGRWYLVPVDAVEKVRLELEERRRLRVHPEQWCHMGCTY